MVISVSSKKPSPCISRRPCDTARLQETWNVGCRLKIYIQDRGEIIEFGTFKGGSAAVLLQESKDEKYLHLFDSFQGMPDVNIQDNFHKKGDFADTQATQVQRGLEKFGNNFELHVGFFADTIPEIEASRPGIQFSLVHIDADLYESILDALKYCYPRMASGAIIVFDDYGSPTCLGAKKAVDEFFENKPETVMQLSGPQYGCVIGGGNIIKKLGENMSFLSRGGSLGRWIFDRSE